MSSSSRFSAPAALLTLAAFAAGCPPAADAAGGVRSVAVADPSLGMTAYTVTMPAGWHFSGMLAQGTGAGRCGSLPAAVWRATSPDGLSAAELMPTFSWVYGTGPLIGYTLQTGCLPLKDVTTGAKFLRLLAGALHVTYVADEPVRMLNALAKKQLAAANAATAASWSASHLQPPKQTVDIAQAHVGYKNGSFAMSGQLLVQLKCTETHFAGMKSILRGMPSQPPSTIDSCDASVAYYTAPANGFAGFLKQWKAPGMGSTFNPAWQNAYMQRAMAESAALSRQQFEQSMALQQQMHDQFMQSMAASTQASMDRANASMNARSAAASDWVDFALDRQTVADPSTGHVSKVSNLAATAWGNGSGQLFASKDPTANPNGILPGNWTKQDFVHGNGTAK